MTYVNAYSARRRTVGSPDPLLHASPSPPVPYSRTGATYRAVCGAQVRNVTRVAWDPGGVGRRCRACVKEVPS